MRAHEEAFYRFGDCVLVPSERLLVRGGRPVALSAKPFDLLVALVEGAGHLLTKDELLARVWPGLVVEEVNLSVNVSALRKALGATPGGSGLIETVPRQGYRFSAPVEIGEIATLNLAELRGREAHDSAAPRGSGTDKPEAYQAYLQARHHWNQRTEGALALAVEHFGRAIELDPGFALAHAGLADAHTTRGYLGHVPPVAAFPVARPHALEALALDPSLAQARSALGYVKLYFDWDWAGAREEFRQAIALDPNDPPAHQWYSVYLLAAGHPEEALREILAAQRLDPLSLAINTDIGFHHYYGGRYPEAIAQLRMVLGMNADFPLAHLWLARTYLQVGRFEEALTETAALEARLKDWPVLLAARGFACATIGRPDEARAILRRMEELSTQRFVTAYGMGLVHAGLGDREEAFRWLERAFEERSHWLVWLRLDPRWKNVRDDPRFAALVARMKYPA